MTSPPSSSSIPLSNPYLFLISPTRRFASRLLHFGTCAYSLTVLRLSLLERVEDELAVDVRSDVGDGIARADFAVGEKGGHEFGNIGVLLRGILKAMIV
jgi:hypothetical protein